QGDSVCRSGQHHRTILMTELHLERCLIRSPLKAFKPKLRPRQVKRPHLEMSAAVGGFINGHDSFPDCGQQLFEDKSAGASHNCRFRGSPARCVREVKPYVVARGEMRAMGGQNLCKSLEVAVL
ncbi:hypothetical protein XENOCAPTIV_011083, partial [Xenoophorus captivus]